MKYTVATLNKDIITTYDFNEALAVFENTSGAYVELKKVNEIENYRSESLLIKMK